MADITIICDVCDETIRVQEFEDFNSAYARHCQSEYHLEVQNRFRSIQLGADTALSNESVTSSEDVAMPSVPANVLYQADNESSNVFFCGRCLVEVADCFAMLSPIQSEEHAKTEGYVENVNGRREMLLQRLKKKLDDLKNLKKMNAGYKAEIAELRTKLETMEERTTRADSQNLHTSENRYHEVAATLKKSLEDEVSPAYHPVAVGSKRKFDLLSSGISESWSDLNYSTFRGIEDKDSSGQIGCWNAADRAEKRKRYLTNSSNQRAKFPGPESQRITLFSEGSFESFKFSWPDLLETYKTRMLTKHT